MFVMSSYSSHDLERRIHQIDLERTLIPPDITKFEITGTLLTQIHADLRQKIQLGLGDDDIRLALQGIQYDLDTLSTHHEEMLCKAGVFDEYDRIYLDELLGDASSPVGQRMSDNRIAFRNVLRLDIDLHYPFRPLSIDPDTKIVAGPSLVPDCISLRSGSISFPEIHRNALPLDGILIHKTVPSFGEYFDDDEDEDAWRF